MKHPGQEGRKVVRFLFLDFAFDFFLPEGHNVRLNQCRNGDQCQITPINSGYQTF